ncbi:AraC family transcriptional regulator [Leifsonia virtsii]|uniref:AraC family transcriptional regulator n=1 Tax=Leifsonia virtsii TaxID=3035915 RepID=A0ABT8J1Q3_9MICO|nr:AraC family transcriptional regulator [Leifsonia virtsii]MDN4599015.1 AraC family transcriptional regulator [Leifsonia virtsii]
MRLPTDPTCVLVQMTATTHAEEAVYRRMRRHSFGHVGLAQIASVPQTVTAHLGEVPAQAMESTQFQLVHSGSLILQQGDVQTRFAAGDLAVYDASRPFSFVYPREFRTTIVQVPTVLLRARGVLPESLNGRTVAGDSTGRLLLEGMLRGVPGPGAQHGYGGPYALSHELVRAARSMLIELGHGEGEPDGLRTDRLVEKAIDRIHASFADPGLTAATLASAFHVSVRTLFAAFEAEGRTVGATIRAARTAAAERLLLTTDATVAEIAHAVGYTDVTAFIRAWKAATGTTPARWRRSVR